MALLEVVRVSLAFEVFSPQPSPLRTPSAPTVLWARPRRRDVDEEEMEPCLDTGTLAYALAVPVLCLLLPPCALLPRAGAEADAPVKSSWEVSSSVNRDSPHGKVGGDIGKDMADARRALASCSRSRRSSVSWLRSWARNDCTSCKGGGGGGGGGRGGV